MRHHLIVALVFVSVALSLATGLLLIPKSTEQNEPVPQGAAVGAATPDSAPGSSVADRAKDSYGKLPMTFEPNVGQTGDQVKFLARGQGYSLFLSAKEATLSLQRYAKSGKIETQSAVRMTIEGANESASVDGEDMREGRSNYFIGNDPTEWRTEVPHYSRVRYRSVYDGVDLVYYGNGQQLEYDFVVRPDRDPSQIRLKFEGLESASVDPDSGDLVLETGSGTVRQLKPFVYQDIDGERTEIASAYHLRKEDGAYQVSFRVADYDRSNELVIDPILAYGTYLGGTAFDEGRAITVDAEGNAYVTGTAASRDFPTTLGTIKPNLLPRTDGNSYWYDAFVTKINPTGTALVFSTYFGGRNGSESGSGIALDADGNVLIAGTTTAGDLPTVNAFQPTFGGTDDGFAAKLNPTGSAIIFSTYLGGGSTEVGGRIAVNQQTGDAVFAGYASSGNFPTTPGVIKPQLCNNTPGSCNGIFYSGTYLVKLTSTGGIVYSTLYDAGVADITLDANDNLVTGGSAGSGAFTTPGAYQPVSSGGADGYISKVNPQGTAVVFATFLGGGLQSDRITSIVLDADQNMYVTGTTENTAFPTTPGAYDTTYNGGHDGFVTKFNSAGSALVFSTFIGGTGKDEPFAIGLAANGDVFTAGESLSNASFPLRNPLLNSGSMVLSRISADGSTLVFSTFLGTGGVYDLATDASSNAYLTGHTTNVLVTPDSVQPTRAGGDVTVSTKDGFVVKIAPADESAQVFGISGTVTDENYGYNHNYAPIVATITGTVNRSISLPYSSNGISTFQFGSLPAGGTYTLTVRKLGFATSPDNAIFPNLAANQFADFTLLRNREPQSFITSPAHGDQFNVGSSVTIQATASDPDNHAISKVEFIAYSSATGSVPLATDTTAPYEFTWDNLPIGTWALYAQPYDELGLRGDTQNVVHIFVVDPTGGNVSFLSPTEGQTFVQGGYVPISVSVSSSVNRVEVRDQTNTLVGIMTGSPWSTQWRVMTPGNYTLTAKAFTQTGQQTTSTPVNIVVNPINHRITGRILDTVTTAGIPGVTLNLTSPTNPSITAQAVTDSDGAYLFTDLGTTPDDGVVITPDMPNYTLTPATRSIGYMGFIDWTNQNFSATANTQISVAITSPTSGQQFTSPATIDIAADATSGAGAISKVDFYVRNNNGTLTFLSTDTSAPYEHQQAGVGVGTYRYFARATDSTGAVKDSDLVQITVVLPTVSLSGRITGPDGNGVSGITVHIGGGYAWTEQTDANGDFIFANYPGGRDYYITPYPQNGLTFTPTSRTYLNVTTNVTGADFVAAAPNQPPSIQLIEPVNGAVYMMPVAVPIQVLASDPNNNINRVRVMVNNGQQLQTIVDTINTTVNTTWQPTTPGTYVVTADVRDTFGMTASQSVTITVNSPSPVSISGRVVDRNSVGIAGATLELRDYPTNQTVAGSATTDANGNFTITNLTTFQSYVLRASKLDYAFSPRQRVYLNLANSQSNADFTGVLQVQPADFDGDGESDLAVWRPSTGVWHVNQSQTEQYSGHRFGGAEFGDVVVPGNYDGDKKTDYGVFRNGIWYIQKSSDGVVMTIPFGTTGDKPVQGDYDGDGKTDLAVWRPSTHVWYVLRSTDWGYSGFEYGTDGDHPLSGDYDGDGLSDFAIFRPSNGTWYITKSSDGQVLAGPFGMDGDEPLVGDFDGDKKADISVFRPSNGVWYVLYSSNGQFAAGAWGMMGDKPVPGDYDRDGKTDIAVFRESDGYWYILYSSTGTYVARPFGMAGDIPIPSAYIR